MTAEQMKYEFDVGYDRITNFDAPGYEPKEISTFLTKAQEYFTHEILDKSAFEEGNKKDMSRLRQVIPLSTFTAGNYPNGFSTPLRVSVEGVGYQFVVGATMRIQPLAPPDPVFVDAGFRVGDVITVTGSSNNDGVFAVIQVDDDGLVLSPQTPALANEGSISTTVIYTDPVFRVRNERADIVLGSTNFYYDKIPVVPATVPVTYNNTILDVEVNPTDDDFYSANKDNPYKKPSIEKIWRIDGADNLQKLHEYITDGTFTLQTVHLHFDRETRAIVVPETTATPYVITDIIDGIYMIDFKTTGLDCLLHPSTHREIVDKAVKLAYAALQDEKGFQISTVQEQQE